MLTNEMNSMFAEGGMMQEGGTVDPVSGNEVPPGAMAEEVRDDIDAKLSEGEFVFPADVVRYVGLETLMKIRDKAKTGLKKMEEIGQMGNASEVPDGEALHGGEDEMDDESFSSEIDSIMSEDDVSGYAAGGYVPRKNQTATAPSTDQNVYTLPDQSVQYANAPIKGFQMVAMTNDSGQTIYIPFINGVPQLSVPSGYKVASTTAGAATAPATTATGVVGSAADGSGAGTGGDGGGGGSTGGSGFGGLATGSNSMSFGPTGQATSNTGISATVGGIVGAVAGTVLGFGPTLGYAAGKSAANSINASNAEAVSSYNAAISDTGGSNVSGGLAATSLGEAAAGVSGVSGGSAAAAGAAAAAAASAAGFSDAAIGAASQAAADAAIGGAGAAGAAAAGAAAAAASDGYAAADAVGADGYGSTGTVGGVDAAAGAAAADAFGGGYADTGSTGTVGVDAAAGAAAADAFGGGYADTGAGTGTGSGSDGGGAGYWAKGGFVSKKKPKIKSKGLASRRN